MNTVAVINCGKSKIHGNQIPAQYIYTGQLFKASKKFVEGKYNCYVILSAKYHCLLPTDLVNYYDHCLNNMSAKDRRSWYDITANQLISKFPKNTHFDFYVSQVYLKGLLPILDEHNISYSCYCNDLSLGRKISYFNNHSNSTEPRKLKLF